jgi:hypothetical protein
VETVAAISKVGHIQQNGDTLAADDAAKSVKPLHEKNAKDPQKYLASACRA